MTNHHVVNLGNEYTVTIGGQQRPARLVATAPCEDLAVLKVANISNLRPLALGSQEKLQLGDTVVALGLPGERVVGQQPDRDVGCGVGGEDERSRTGPTSRTTRT